MSQAGYTPISLYYSTTAAAVPTSGNLVAGELAINTLDGKLYYKNSAGTVTLLASTSGASGDVVGPASATDNALARFDLTTGKLIQNSVGILSDAGILTGLTGLTSSGSITLSSLTSGRVTYAGTAGLLQDSANLTFNGTTLTANTIGAYTLSGTIAGGGNQLNNIIIGTSTPLAGAFTTINASTSITNAGLTSGRVTYAGASGLLSDSANLTFNGTNLAITGTLSATSNISSTAGGFYSTRASGNSPILDLTQTGVYTWDLINTATTGLFSIRGNTTPFLSITSATGNVGIGTSSPVSKLDVTGQVTATGGIFKANGAPSLSVATAGEAILAPESSLGALLYGRGTTYDVVIGQRSTAVALGVLAGTNNVTFPGNVGIGTSSPSAALSVIASPMVNQLLIGASTADSGYGSISFNGTSGATRIGFTGGGSGDPSLYYDAATAGIHQFRVNNAIKMVLDSNGNLLVGITTARANAGDVQVSKGISFPATQSAQSDANTLDDYEEGTWTPEINTTTPPTTPFGQYNDGATYTKIGNVVYIKGMFRTNGVTIAGASGSLYIGGLPFVPSSALVGGVTCVQTQDFATNAPRFGYPSTASRMVLNYTPTATGNTGNCDETSLTTGSGLNNLIQIFGFYTV